MLSSVGALLNAAMPSAAARDSKQVLASKFQLADEIGRGASGVVYKALNLQTGGMVAIKEVQLRGESKDQLQLLQREIDLLKLLKNPYIVKYMESFNTRETLYIVMEFVENGSLASIVKRCREPTRSPALHVAPPRPAGMGGCPSRLPACIRCRCAACASPRFLGKL